jgi:hypothetical protein
MDLWRVTIEGTVDGLSFLRNYYVAEIDRAKAVDTALAEFSSTGDSFIEVVASEIEVANCGGKAGTIRVDGRIFFGS